MRVWLLACLLVACSEPPSEGLRTAKKAARVESSERALSVTPPLRSYRYDSGQLLVLEVPFKDSQGFLETHRCLIWRDDQFKSATLSCPGAAPDESVPLEHAEPERTH